MEERDEPAIAAPKTTRMIVYGARALLEMIVAVREIARKAEIMISKDGIAQLSN